MMIIKRLDYIENIIYIHFVVFSIKAMRSVMSYGRPDIPEIPVYFRTVNGQRKSDSFGKKRNYRNC